MQVTIELIQELFKVPDPAVDIVLRIKGYKKEIGDFAESSSPERRVCDFIASMTDRYAQNMYQRIFWPKSLA